jgi:hypothetical protein
MLGVLVVLGNSFRDIDAVRVRERDGDGAPEARPARRTAALLFNTKQWRRMM